MKTVIISDNDRIIDFFTRGLSEKGYDVIVYRWLMKALDNLEEIRPQLVIVDADEYPRHWKTLAAFLMSGICGEAAGLYLYSPAALSSDEAEKAEALGVRSVFVELDESALEEFKSLKVRPALSYPSDSASEPTDGIILTDPDDNSFSYGSVENQEENTYICSVKDSARYSSGQFLKYVSFFHNGMYTNCSAQVVRIDNEQKSLSLRIKDLYAAG